VNARDFSHLVPDGEDRVQGRHRLLKDEADAIAANRADPLIIEGEQVLAVESDRAACLDPTRRPNEPENREPGDRFPAAGFTDEAERLATRNVEGDAIDGTRDSRGGVEIRPQVGDGEEGDACHRRQS
jgi:hypothetical protein